MDKLTAPSVEPKIALFVSLIFPKHIPKINEIIKERRLELGYTQEQLGALLNLSSSAVNRWEKGVSQTKGY